MRKSRQTYRLAGGEKFKRMNIKHERTREELEKFKEKIQRAKKINQGQDADSLPE